MQFNGEKKNVFPRGYVSIDNSMHKKDRDIMLIIYAVISFISPPEMILAATFLCDTLVFTKVSVYFFT